MTASNLAFSDRPPQVTPEGGVAWATPVATKSLDVLMREAGDTSEHSLKRARLGPVNLVTLGIGAVIGAGIFVLDRFRGRAVRGPAIILSYVWLERQCVFAGLCYAEFASSDSDCGLGLYYGYSTLGETLPGSSAGI